MRKLIISVAAMAAMMLAGCQQEQLEPVSGNAVVTYSVEIPEVATKATVVDDGSNINDLVYAVYRTTAQKLEDVTSDNISLVYQKNPESTLFEDGKTIVSLELVNDQNYVVLFWAQVADAWVAGNDFDLTSIGYPASMNANDSGLAAFAGVDFLSKVDAPASKGIELKRPFAQINVGTTLADNYTITLSKSSVTVKGAGEKFDMLTQKAEGTRDVTFALAEVPAGTITVNSTAYQYAGMNYVFANGNVEVTYDIETAAHGTVNNTVPAVPVEKNYRTNIIGNLLTSDTEYTVTLDKEWGEPAKVVKVVVASTAEDILDAIEDAGSGEGQQTQIDLGNDIDLGNGGITLTSFAATKAGEPDHSIYVPANADVVLNLNGKKISQNFTESRRHAMIKNDGKLTIMDSEGDGKLSYKYSGNADSSYGYANSAIENAGVLTINGGVVENTTEAMSHASYAINTGAGAVLDINGGKVINMNGHAIRTVSFGAGVNTVNINGGYVEGTRAIQLQLPGSDVNSAPEMKLTVTGGELKSNEETYNLAVYAYSNGQSGKNVQIEFDSEAVVNGNVALNAAVTSGAQVLVKGGAFNGHYGVYSYSDNDEDAKAAISITGGVFVADPSDYVANGYAAKKSDDIWIIVPAPLAVQDGYEISNAAQFRYFAESINAGEDKYNANIRLTADIDLNNEEWTPIGSVYQEHGFMGNFDGDGKIIKNLKMTGLVPDSDGYVYAGLFGVTEGSESQRNYVKNFTIENVSIQTNGHIVAAAIAYPYYTTVENITVKGDINIKGGNYTAGALAYTRRLVDAKDITVAGNEDSVIEGNSTVGGVISDIQTNGALTANYSDFSATGLTIKGTKCVGGISGIISQQALDGATVKNVTLVSEDNRTGIVSGATGGNATLTNVSYENVTGATRVIGATYDGGYYVGQILELAGAKAIVYTIEGDVKAVSVAQGGKMTWDEAVAWAQKLGEGWALASLDDLKAIWSVRVDLNKVLAADDAANVLFEEDNKEEDGSYAAYWSSTLVEGSTTKANYLYFDNDASVMTSFIMFPVEYSRAVYTIK